MVMSILSLVHTFLYLFPFSIALSHTLLLFSSLQSRSGPCLLDCIKLELTEVDVFSALKVPLDGDKFKIVRQV